STSCFKQHLKQPFDPGQITSGRQVTLLRHLLHKLKDLHLATAYTITAHHPIAPQPLLVAPTAREQPLSPSH
ncbi:hypothetical protein M9458_047177, partial [Cirrhinus mrigala]